MIRPAWLAAFWIANALAPARAEAEAPWLVQISQRYAAAGTFRMSFEQRYESAGFGTEVQGKGTVTVAAGRLLWDYRQPAGRRGAFDGTQWWMLDPEDRQVVIKSVGQAGEDPLVGLLSGRPDALHSFAATESSDAASAGGDLVLHLTPRDARDDLELVLLELTRATSTVRRVTVVDPLGNRTTFLFGTPESCAEPRAAAFRLNIPKGYDVIHE